MNENHRRYMSIALDIFAIIALYFLGQLTVGIGLSLWGIRSTTDLADNQLAVLVSYICGAIAMVVGLFGYMRLREVPSAVLRLKRPTLRSIFYGVAGYLTYVVLVIVALTFVSYFIPAIDLDQKQELGLSSDPSTLTLIPMFFALVLAPAISEELLFRGFLFGQLQGKKVSFIISSLITSGLFAVMHGQANVAINTFVLSMVMLFFLKDQKNLTTTIVMHLIKNTIAFLGLFVFS